MENTLKKSDPVIYNLIQQEEQRQYNSIRLIPSENYVSKSVMTATGSCLTNKYSEGYPGKRYYEGQQITDQVENIARDRAKKLFKCGHVNVQSYSGSVANFAAYNAILQPGDTILGLALPYGGHLTHGWKVSSTAKYFKSVQYTLRENTGLMDFNQIEELAKKHKPKVIVSGATAYPREIDFKSFGEIAKRVGAYHMSDIAHIAGLVVAGAHKSPVPHADIVTTTTHKTLRGPRGGMIMCTEALAKQIDKSVFPEMQGGPHIHSISGVAVALGEADTPDFVNYGRQIVLNAGRLAQRLLEYGFNLVTGGTDNHLILIDLRNKNIPGKVLAKALDRAHLETNYNSVPGDTAPPFNPSGLRIGTPATTTRGMKEPQMDQIAAYINRVAGNLENETAIEAIGKEVVALCNQFPLPDYLVKVS